MREAYEEHKQIKNLLAQISSIALTDETYDVKIKVLKDRDVEHHVKAEEGEMFRHARKSFGGSRLMETGRRNGNTEIAAGEKFRVQTSF